MDKAKSARELANETSLAAMIAAQPPAASAPAAEIAQLKQNVSDLEQHLASYKQMRDVRDDEFARVLARNRQLEAIVQQYEQMCLKAQQQAADAA